MRRRKLKTRYDLSDLQVHVEESEVMTDDQNAEVGYDARKAVIRVRRDLTPNQKRYYVAHELIHAAVDNLHQAMQNGAVP